MNVLLVHPGFPTTYWGFQYSLPLVGYRSSLPPLGLVTLAALLPPDWQMRLKDLNVSPLDPADLAWADVVMTGGMHIQGPGIHEVIARAHAAGKPAVVGGPSPTTAPEEYRDADVIFAGEAETRVPELVAAVAEVVALYSDRSAAGPRVPPCDPEARGNARIQRESTESHTRSQAEHADPRGSARVLPDRGTRPSLGTTLVPRFDLLDLDAYASVSIQYSRGCPFTCEFCDIIEIFGRVPRTKTPAQVVAELEALYRLGYRGSIFFVDDNFIGNGKAVRELLPIIARWQAEHGNPFAFYTEASVNLAADTELVQAMVAAGFVSVFLGIETPSPETLREAGKRQNAAVDLVEAVNTLSRAGLEVMGGFIVGFDHDDERVFDVQRDFISALPVPLAMVGILTALPGTALWRRLDREGRLVQTASGDQFGRPNFRPRMGEEALLRGYARLLEELYSPEAYEKRCIAYLEMAPARSPGNAIRKRDLEVAGRLLWHLGIVGKWRGLFWRLVCKALSRGPALLPYAFARALMAEHMIRYTHEVVLPRIREALEQIGRDANGGTSGASGPECRGGPAYRPEPTMAAQDCA